MTFDDLRGVLHCHSEYSDGTATIEAMAAAAKERGWDYIGISDHSESAFYAGGLKRDKLLRQHEEIDAAECADERDFPSSRGIEADTSSPTAKLDYDMPRHSRQFRPTW